VNISGALQEGKPVVFGWWPNKRIVYILFIVLDEINGETG